jgi:hypothetical protein
MKVAVNRAGRMPLEVVGGVRVGAVMVVTWLLLV